MSTQSTTRPYPASREPFNVAIAAFHKDFIERLVSLGLDSMILAPEDQAVKMQLLLDKFKFRQDLSARLCGIAARGRPKEASTQIGIQEAIRLIGFYNSRLFVCAELMSEVFKNPLFSRSGDTGTFVKSVREILKHTKQLVDIVGEESRYRETAFASGLIFDALFYFIQENQNTEVRSRLTLFLEQQYKLCQESLKQSLLTGKALDRLVIGDRLPCLLSLITAGQVAMFLYFPEMVVVYRRLNEKAAFETVYRYAELMICGGYATQFSRQLSLVFQPFANIPLAIEFFSDPTKIKGKKSPLAEDQKTLAELAHFSMVITKYGAEIERRVGSYPAKEVCPELSDCALVHEFQGAR